MEQKLELNEMLLTLGILTMYLQENPTLSEYHINKVHGVRNKLLELVTDKLLE